MMDNSSAYYYSDEQLQQQYWDLASTSAHEVAPMFTHPFDLKHAPLGYPAPMPMPLPIDFNFEPAAYLSNFSVPPPPQVFVPEQPYYAPSPTLSDLSSLSSGGTFSPHTPQQLLAPMSPPPHISDALLFGTPSPIMQHQHMLLPPRPLPDSPAFSSSPALSSVSPASSTTTLPPAAAEGPAAGEFAVLTLTGHTIAASGNYRDVLSAARSVRRAAETGLGDDSRTCGYCGKVCDRPSTLKTHLNSHTGERPHMCTVAGCTRHFTVLSNMYRHAKVCAAQRAREVRKAAAAAARR